MTNLLLDIWSNPELLTKLLIAIAIVVLVVFLFIKFSGIRPIIYIVGSIFIVFFGITTTIENVRYLELNNTTVGSVLDSTFKSVIYVDETEPGEFVLNNFGFKQTEGNLYETTFKQPGATLDFENNQYVLYINDCKCYLTNQGEDYMFSEFTYAFYDTDLELILVDTLTIKIGLTENETTIIIQTYGGLNATELWKSYQVKNNFVMKFTTATADDFNFIEGGLENGNLV